eukprot:scaffold2094_cov146-Amphora_coffeaeformis.AAC.1
MEITIKRIIFKAVDFVILTIVTLFSISPGAPKLQNSRSYHAAFYYEKTPSFLVVLLFKICPLFVATLLQ